GQPGERGAEAADVGFVERRVHLVQNAEGRRVDLEDREEQRRGCEGALAAREQRKGLLALAGRAGQDLDSYALDAVVGVAAAVAVVAAVGMDEQKLGLTAAEQSREAALELGR